MTFFDYIHSNGAMPDAVPAHATPSNSSFPSSSSNAVIPRPAVDPEAIRADAGMPDLEKGLTSSVEVSMVEAHPSAIPRILSAIPKRVSQVIIHPLQENNHRVSTSQRPSGSVDDDSRKRSTEVRMNITLNFPLLKRYKEHPRKMR